VTEATLPTGTRRKAETPDPALSRARTQLAPEEEIGLITVDADDSTIRVRLTSPVCDPSLIAPPTAAIVAALSKPCRSIADTTDAVHRTELSCAEAASAPAGMTFMRATFASQ
jgi:hypothetical protein